MSEWSSRLATNFELVDNKQKKNAGKRKIIMCAEELFFFLLVSFVISAARRKITCCGLLSVFAFSRGDDGPTPTSFSGL